MKKIICFLAFQKKKRSKEFKTAISKVKEYYEKFHLINTKLKEVTEHEVVLPNEMKRWVMNDFKLIQQQISCIIETVNKLEHKYRLTKLTFDVKRVLPKIANGPPFLEKCYQIDQFLNGWFRCYSNDLKRGIDIASTLEPVDTSQWPLLQIKPIQEQAGFPL